MPEVLSVIMVDVGLPYKENVLLLEQEDVVMLIKDVVLLIDDVVLLIEDVVWLGQEVVMEDVEGVEMKINLFFC